MSVKSYKASNTKICLYCHSAFIPDNPGKFKCDSKHPYMCPICHNGRGDGEQKKFFLLPNIDYKEDTREFDVRIDIDSSKTSIRVSNQTYGGRYLEPKPIVTYDDKELSEGSDYTVEYETNLVPGQAKVIVNGIGKFTGSKESSFTIRKIKAKDCVIQKIPDQLNQSDTYTKIEICPKIHMRVNEKVFSPSQDYYLEYSHNNDIGTATIDVISEEGSVLLEGQTSVTFEIVPQDVLDNVYVIDIPDQLYDDGRVVKPKPIVFFKGYLTEEGTDYTLRYKNNTSRGLARIEITSCDSTYLPDGDLITWSHRKVATFRIV